MRQDRKLPPFLVLDCTVTILIFASSSSAPGIVNNFRALLNISLEHSVFLFNMYLEGVATFWVILVNPKANFLFTTVYCLDFTRKINRKKGVAEIEICFIAKYPGTRAFLFKWQDSSG